MSKFLFIGIIILLSTIACSFSSDSTKIAPAKQTATAIIRAATESRQIAETRMAETPTPTQITAAPTPEISYIVPVADFPGVVEGMKGTPNGIELVSERLCFDINEAEIWEPGDFYFDDKDLPSVRIKINNRIIPIQYVLKSLLPIFEYDDQGNQIGLHGNYTLYCTSPSLDSGLHTIEVKITTTSDRLAPYIWEFYVP